MPQQKGPVEEAKESVSKQIGRVANVELGPLVTAMSRHHPQHMAPPLPVSWRMGVVFQVTVFVMLAMNGNPHDGRSFAGEQSAKRQKPPHPPIRFETAVRLRRAVESERWHDFGYPPSAILPFLFPPSGSTGAMNT